MNSGDNFNQLIQTDNATDFRDAVSSDPTRSAQFELADKFKNGQRVAGMGVSIKAGGEVIHR